MGRGRWVGERREAEMSTVGGGEQACSAVFVGERRNDGKNRSWWIGNVPYG